jgi:hypothetical protein
MQVERQFISRFDLIAGLLNCDCVRFPVVFSFYLNLILTTNYWLELLASGVVCPFAGIYLPI